MSSQLDGTLDLSHACSWKPASAPSKPHPCHWCRKHQSQANTMWCTTSHTLTTPCLQQPSSTSTLIATSSHACGEPSPPFSCPSHAYPQDHRPLCVMLQRPTEQYLQPHPSGQALSSVCKQLTGSQSTHVIILGSPQQGGSMAWSQMQVQTFSGAVELALWQNGLMIIYSSGSREHTYEDTMSGERGGSRRYT